MPELYYRFQEGHIPGYNNIYERGDFFGMMNETRNVDMQVKLTTEGVNNIVAAYFIKSIQQKRASIKPVETIIHKEEVSENNVPENKGMTDIQPDLNSITNNQLSSVSDMMKKIIEKDLTK